MRRLAFIAVLALACLPFAPCHAAEKPTPPTPLVRAHAHNDYEHKRPLFDALENGFCSVEADVWLVDGRLLVAHDLKQTKPERTLEALYLEPLRQRMKQNGGRVYPDGPPVTLLIDVKSEAQSTYVALKTSLSTFAEMLTSFTPGSTRSNAVIVIISGNRDRKTMAAEPHRLAAYDGRLDALDSTDSRHFIPLVSSNWALNFKWRGTGSLPAGEKLKLKQLVDKAHGQGRRLRFWNTPDSPAFWRELFVAGVDLLNVDDLAGLQTFLLAQSVR
jgi:hypothetical protein